MTDTFSATSRSKISKKCFTNKSQKWTKPLLITSEKQKKSQQCSNKSKLMKQNASQI